MMKQKYVPLFALYELGKGNISIFHVEDVAIKSKEISPQSFTWNKYPDNIDLRQVQRTMRSLRRIGYVNGTNVDGWSLTNSGIEIVTKSEFIKNASSNRHTKDYDREIIRIESSNAFTQWQEFNEVDKRNALKLLRIDEYSSIAQIDAKKEKFLLIANQILKIDDKFDDFVKKVISHI